MKILLFAGTGDGHDLALWLREQGFPFTVCVATEYGEALLPEGMDIHVGRMDVDSMAALMGKGYTVVVDATHPYAVEATKNIRAAAETTGLPCLRLLRQSDREDQSPGWWSDAVPGCCPWRNLWSGASAWDSCRRTSFACRAPLQKR